MQIYKWVPARVEEQTQPQDIKKNGLSQMNQLNSNSDSQSKQEISSEVISTQNGASDSNAQSTTNGTSKSGSKPSSLSANNKDDQSVSTATAESNGMNKENVGSDLDSCSNSASSLMSDNEVHAAVVPTRDEPSKIVTTDRDEIVRTISEKQEESVFKEIAKVQQEKEEAEAVEKAKKAEETTTSEKELDKADDAIIKVAELDKQTGEKRQLEREPFDETDQSEPPEKQARSDQQPEVDETKEGSSDDKPDDAKGE